MLPRPFLAELRRGVDIVAYISERIVLKKSGTAWKGLCPFHSDSRPSLSVRSDPPSFHCFGCGEGGDIFTFVMRAEGLPFPKAVDLVAARAGLSLPGRDGAEPARVARQHAATLEAAAQHFTRNLWAAGGRQGRRYLSSRGLRRESVEFVRAGFAVDAWDDLLRGLAPRFSVELLEAAGLVYAPHGRALDRFRNRVMLPILSEAGTVIGFAGRTLDGSGPKYLNSPDTPLYRKGRVLYGYAWAADTIRRRGRAVLVEGYFDAILAHQAGIREAVAVCGAIVTADQALLLRRLAPAAILSFDADQAGERATGRAIELLLERDVEPRVAQLPPAADPDQYILSRGPKAYAALLETARHWSEWTLARATSHHDASTTEGKAACLDALLPLLKHLADPVRRAAWIGRLAHDLRLDEGALHSTFGNRRLQAVEFRWVSFDGHQGTGLVDSLEALGWRRVASHRWYPDTWLMERPSRETAQDASRAIRSQE